MTTAVWAIIIPTALAIVGAAIGFGALRNDVKRMGSEFGTWKQQWLSFTGQNPGGQPRYIRREECESLHGGLDTSIVDIKDTQAKHGKALNRLDKFARWLMTEQYKKTPADADEILNGDD